MVPVLGILKTVTLRKQPILSVYPSCSEHLASKSLQHRESGIGTTNTAITFCRMIFRLCRYCRTYFFLYFQYFCQFSFGVQSMQQVKKICTPKSYLSNAFMQPLNLSTEKNNYSACNTYESICFCLYSLLCCSLVTVHCVLL